MCGPRRQRLKNGMPGGDVALDHKHTMKNRPWIDDPCADANGHTTIRSADGSKCGDTDVEPIATVYDEKHACLIAAAPEMVSFMSRMVSNSREIVRLSTAENVSRDMLFEYQRCLDEARAILALAGKSVGGAA